MSPPKDTRNRGQARKHGKKRTARPTPKRFHLRPWLTLAGGALLIIIAVGAMVWAARPKAVAQSRSQQAEQVGEPSSSDPALDVPHVYYGST